MGEPEAERHGTGLPAGWHVSIGFDREYLLSPAGRPPVRNVHPGIDLAAAAGATCGAAVYAVADGVVVASATESGSWGTVVMLRHDLPGGPLWSQYAHLATREVSIGDRVAQGEVIGTVGDAGGKFACHLHLELRRIELPAGAWPAAGGASIELQHRRVREQYVDPIGLLGA